DLAPQRGDVGLRPSDPRREPGDLRLLLGQAPLDLLELGEQRGLAGARGRGLLALLLQALLRLLELFLLALQRILTLRLCARGRDREREQCRQQEGEAGEAGPVGDPQPPPLAHLRRSHRAHAYAPARPAPTP